MHILVKLTFLTSLMLPATAYSGEVCVLNNADQAYFFAAETHGGARMVGMLAAGETLCASGAETGVVSVFEDKDALEGCSRLVAAGRTETFLKYVDFDRCFWSSNSG